MIFSCAGRAGVGLGVDLLVRFLISFAAPSQNNTISLAFAGSAAEGGSAATPVRKARRRGRIHGQSGRGREEPGSDTTDPGTDKRPDRFSRSGNTGDAGQAAVDVSLLHHEYDEFRAGADSGRPAKVMVFSALV